VIAYFVEVGLVLLIFPWTAYWDHNYFVTLSGSVQPALASPWVRGGVSGLGLMTLLAGFADLFDLLARRSGRESATSAG
jgi:hypothetical protein